LFDLFARRRAQTRTRCLGSEVFAGLTDGGLVGGGLDRERRHRGAFTENLTARIEYLFVDLSNASFNSAPGVTVKLNNLNLIRVGLDYKFNGW
jgi:hypothetical protein